MPPIAYVRDTGKISTSAAGTSEANFATLPAVGNHVFGCVSSWFTGSAPITFADNQGNSWAKQVEAEIPTTGRGTSSIGSAKVATSAGTFTIQLDASPFSKYWEWIGVEFSGIAASSFSDQTGTATDTTAGHTSITVTATGANIQPNELVLAVFSTDSTDTNINVSNPPSTYTALSVQQDSTATVGHQASYKIVASGETSACTWSLDALPVGGNITAAIATYKGADAGVVGPKRSSFLQNFFPGP